MAAYHYVLLSLHLSTSWKPGVELLHISCLSSVYVLFVSTLCHGLCRPRIKFPHPSEPVWPTTALYYPRYSRERPRPVQKGLVPRPMYVPRICSALMEIGRRRKSLGGNVRLFDFCDGGSSELLGCHERHTSGGFPVIPRFRVTATCQTSP
jgi:hypothetical protein